MILYITWQGYSSGGPNSNFELSARFSSNARSMIRSPLECKLKKANLKMTATATNLAALGSPPLLNQQGCIQELSKLQLCSLQNLALPNIDDDTSGYVWPRS